MQNTTLLRRIGAMIYDALLLFALLMLASIPFITFRGGEAVPPLTDHFFRLTLAMVIYIFFIAFWMRSGRTLGMQSWRLQLESMDGSDLNFAAANIRFFTTIHSWLPVGLGFFWSLWDKDRLTWHDRISKTRIVHYPSPQGKKP